MSVGDDGRRGRIGGGLQRLAQAAKQGLHLLFVQHSRLHQQLARPGRDQRRIALDRSFDRVFDEPDRATSGRTRTRADFSGSDVKRRHFRGIRRVRALHCWEIHLHAAPFRGCILRPRVRRLFNQTLP
jgi:hypothetical protein